MGKVMDRILWTILILALGVSLFVFGKPALVNLTNQVLHHDDLKATMQAPSLTSLDLTRISAANNDVGVSKHAYILGSTKGIADFDLWGGVQRRAISFPHEVQTTPIPYGSYLKAIIKIKVDKLVAVTVDNNDYPPAGVPLWNNGGDNDDWPKRVFMVDGKRVNFGGPDPSQRTTLTPGTWHTLEMEYDNSSVQNTSKVALYDQSILDFWNENDGNVSVQTKDAIFAVDAIKYRS